MSRPENYNALLTSIKQATSDFYWVVVLDSVSVGDLFKSHNLELPTVEKNIKLISYPSLYRGISGNPQRNHALDFIREGYIYYLDDDNIVHPDLIKNTAKYINVNQGVIVSQITKEGNVRLVPRKDKIGVCQVDTAQFLFPTYMTEGIRWLPHDYCADGIYLSEIYHKNESNFVLLDDRLSYYNYLR
jgi:hypothetical protein